MNHRTQRARKYGVSAFVLMASALSLFAEDSGFRVSQLRCEGSVEPLVVETQHPVLRWNLSSEGRGVFQSAFQVLVATQPDLLNETDADLWNSGQRDSAAQQVSYAGAPLDAAARAFWTVRLWNDLNEVSQWSASASWTMGLPNRADWRGKWIAGMETASQESDASPAPLPIFRKKFEVARPVNRAVAFVCGLGNFDFSINGEKVGDHFGDPGWTDYKDSCLYVTFDVTEYLRSGNNAMGVMLGNGMYNVTGGRYTKFTGSFGEPKLIMQMRIEYDDGSVESIVTDDSWRTDHGPITFSCVYGGEDYDARMEQPGWDEPGFDDAHWKPARMVAGPGGVLRASEAPPVTVAESLRPVRIENPAPGEYVADMGFNLSARPIVKLAGPAGSQVVVRVGELRDAPWEGHSYTYTLRGNGDEWLMPRFTYFGFQYIFIEGAVLQNETEADASLPRILEVGSEFVTSSAPRVGAFRCDNDLLNDINAMIDRSVRSNLQSVLTDCPHREKLGWLEVAHLMGPSILYHYDAAGLYRKICRDTSESQLENGLVPDIAPEYTRFSGGFFESAEWGSASVQIPWLLYRWYGDAGILARQFDTMAKYTRYLASTRNEEGLAKGGLGDWYDWTPENSHAGLAQLTPLELTATAMLFDNARVVSAVAELLGKKEDAEYFANLAESVRADFLDAYYDAGSHSVSTGSQAAISVGLHFGLVPTDDREAVLANLVRAVETMNYRPTTGEVCFRYMVRSLAEGGRSDVVYRIVNRTDPPGYGCMLRQYGLKTLSECWDKPGSSLNHCMFGHIQEWFQGNLLGIRQSESSLGFEHVIIAPTPVGDLREAAGHYDSPRGRIAVAWKSADAIFQLDVTVPGNTDAQIVLPVPEDATITESGLPLDEAPGIRIKGLTPAGMILEVGSGRYEFVANYGGN